VRVEVPEELADELAGSLGLGALGVEVTAGTSGRATLSIFVETEDDARGAAERIEGVLAEIPGGRDRPAVVETAADDRWVERYQERLQPFPLGGRFVVLPPETKLRTGADRTAIRMVPGRAFGTGEHPTTRLCAAALEERVSAGSLWIDVGTGSGILALVAAHLGARKVIAVDVDPDAVEVAREWIERNRMASIVEARASGIGALSEEAADGAVVNISAPYLEGEARGLARLLRAGGTLVASGFQAEDLGPAASALEDAGFLEADRAIADGWACLVVRLGSEEATWDE
jgi:ribosomal protein L11 methyltransferase